MAKFKTTRLLAITKLVMDFEQGETWQDTDQLLLVKARRKQLTSTLLESKTLPMMFWSQTV